MPPIRRTPLTLLRLAVACLLIPIPLPGNQRARAAAGVEPVVRDPRQIEADWASQQALRRPKDPQGQIGPRGVRDAVRDGLELAEALARQGMETAAAAGALNEISRALRAAPEAADSALYRDLYLRARWIIRSLAFSNPLLDFDDLLFVKRVPASYSHVADQSLGWFSRPGGGLYVLESFKSERPRLRCLTTGLPPGSVLRPDLSYDGTRVLFAYCRYYPGLSVRPDKLDKTAIPEDAFYHLYEVRTDGSGLRRLTRGRYDDFDGVYLPDGRVVFVSTRRGQFVQCTRGNTAQTLRRDLPDGYMRCGGSRERPVAVYTLQVLDPAGQDLQFLSAFESFEFSPSVGHDGRILYTRWDYVDRDNLPYFSLWSTLPDGSFARAVYGNFTTDPIAMLEARSVPNSNRLVFTASAQHSITGGSLVLLDPRQGPDVPEAMKRLTPEVVFPESEGWPRHYYANPFPLSEDFYLVAWSNQRLVEEHERSQSLLNPPNATGLYLLDAFGNLDLIYRDPEISSAHPMPVRPRPRPPAVAVPVHQPDRDEGRLLLVDVYQGLQGVPRGSIRRLRIVGLPPKTQPVTNFPQLGVTEDDAGKFVLGTVPVEEDGSSYFRVPSGVPLFFQALDAEGMAVQTMRSAAYVPAGRTMACVGCHEPRTSAPPGRLAAASQRPPARIAPGPEGSWPLDFDRLVQPVLDRHCVRCHRPGADGGASNLRAGYAYSTLLAYGEQGTLQSHVTKRYNAGFSAVNECAARTSALLALLNSGHYQVRLDDEDRERLVIWMDTYAQRVGSFGPEQERALRQLRIQWAPLLAEPESTPPTAAGVSESSR